MIAAKRAATSVAVWVGVFLAAELVVALALALAGQPELTAPLWGAFIASVNHHRRVRRRGQRRPK